MISWFKKYFIPHEGNGHRPHFLHKDTTRNIIFTLFFIELILLILPNLLLINLNGSRFLGSVLPAVLDDLSNQNRQLAQLPSLKENALLDKAAQLKANDMSSKGYFAHNSPDGKTPWYWFNQVGYKYDYAGENLAVNFTDSKDVDTAWMNSPTHRANILKPAYTEIGTGLSSGMYDGKPAIFVVQLYGAPQTLVNTPTQTITASASSGQATTPGSSPTKPEPIAQNPEGAAAVLGASAVNTAPVANPVNPSVVDTLVASPHQTTNKIFFGVLVVVCVALLLKILIKPKIRHPDLITNGLLIIVIILGLYLINNQISSKNGLIKSGVEPITHTSY